MFCTKCGAEQFGKDPKFCSQCGAPLDLDVPEPEPAPAAQPAPGSSNQTKRIAIIAAAAVALIALVVVALLFNKPAQNATPAPAADAQPSPEPEPAPGTTSDDDLTTEEKRAFFVGKWVAQDSSDEKMPAAWFEHNAAQGVYYTLILWDDGTGVFRTEEGPTKLTWEADSVTAAHAVAEERDLSISLRANKLTMTNPEGVSLYFVPEDEVDLSNAVDLSSAGMGVTVDPNTIEVNAYSKLIGNESVAYMQVPEGWVNRIDDLNADDAKQYDAVYYVDKTTEYLSPSIGHYAFMRCVQMSRRSVSYKELAQQIVDAFNSDDRYGDVSTDYMTVGKRRAIYITCTDEQDGINISRMVIDRDNDDKVSVTLAFNCGAVGDTQSQEWALSFASTWTVE